MTYSRSHAKSLIIYAKNEVRTAQEARLRSVQKTAASIVSSTGCPTLIVGTKNKDAEHVLRDSTGDRVEAVVNGLRSLGVRTF